MIPPVSPVAEVTRCSPRIIRRPGKWHRCHVVISVTGEEFICKVFVWDGGETAAGFPPRLLYRADWVYDLDERKIVKSRDGKFHVPLGVIEVDEEWLRARGYTRR